MPDAVHQPTMAATIAAPPEDVWPWLARMGCGRAGWCSYDLLDNGGRPSAWAIDPRLQRIAEGDVVPNVPNRATGFTVAGMTRPIVRIRAAGPTPWHEAPVRRFWGLAHGVMQRKQLREIAARAETRA